MVEPVPAQDALPAFPLPALAPRAWREETLARAAEMQTLSNWLDPRQLRGGGQGQELSGGIVMISMV